MIHSLIKIMIGFFLSLLFLILIPQIYNNIYGEHTYYAILWFLINFIPHASVLFFKRTSIVTEHRKLLYGLFAVFYLFIFLSLLLRPIFLGRGISENEQWFLSFYALIPIQLMLIFLLLLSTKSNQIPTSFSAIPTISREVYLKKLQNLISEGDIEEAIDLSLQFYIKDKEVYKQLILQKNRLSSTNSKESVGSMSLDDAEVVRNRVAKALLDLAMPKE